MLSNEYALNPEGLCLMCKGKLVSDPGTEETVCSSCGIVHEEQSSYAPQQDFIPVIPGEPMHFGMEPASGMKYDLDLPTMIGPKNVDVRGNTIAASYDLNRLRRLNNVTLPKDSERKSMSQAIDTIRRITEKLNAGSAVAERAYRIYRKTNGAATSARRKAIANAAMASVFIACKELGIARSSREIESAIKEINPKGVRHYSNSIKNQIQVDDNTPDAASFVSRIATRAGLSGKTERKSIEILQSVKGNMLLIGKRPVPIAAAALFVAASLSGEYMTLSRIACVAEVTPITVRKRSLEISQLLSEFSHKEAAAS